MGASEEFQPTPRTGQAAPPEDPLWEVFTGNVLKSWRKAASSSPELASRLRIIEACGPYPSDPTEADRLRSLRAIKAAWEAYLFASFARQMFEGEKGKDLLGRLRGTGDDSFRSAMAECMVCWFLSGRMKLPVNPFAPGRGTKNLEMRIVTDAGEIGVEVKAPFREAPKPSPGKSTVCWVGDDADKIAQCLESANKQFGLDRPNILVIAPSLRPRLYSNRHELVKAIYGESKITIPMNVQTGEPGATGVTFFPDGKFPNTMTPGGRPLKVDGLPGYRRIGAVVSIEEKIVEKHPCPSPFALLDKDHSDEIWPMWDRARRLDYSSDNMKWMEHDVLVLHNPFAYYPVSQAMWGEFPQFVPVEGKMMWTDDSKTDV